MCSICRIHSAIYHRIYLLISRKGLCTGTVCICDGIADPGIPHVFNTGCDITNHPGAQLLTGNKLTCTKVSDLHNLLHCSGCHHPNSGSPLHRTFHHSAGYDYPTVGIIDRIKDQCLQRIFRISCRSRNFIHDFFQYILHI